MERTNFTFVSLPHWFRAIATLFVFSLLGAQQLSAQCNDDVWAPIIVYPSQDIVVTLDPCDQGPALVFFEVTVTDNCEGDHFPAAPGDPVVPGSEFTVTAFSGPDLTTIFSAGGDRFLGAFEPGVYQVQISPKTPRATSATRTSWSWSFRATLPHQPDLQRFGQRDPERGLPALHHARHGAGRRLRLRPGV
ncbi:MAG: hypothetical protein H6557_02155 [Lewinellaceae bacterium]|nr:hypothetical protein [Lewinellaceae bacterium]